MTVESLETIFNWSIVLLWTFTHKHKKDTKIRVDTLEEDEVRKKDKSKIDL